MNTFLLVGLGNPGTKYALTRHNIGFLAVDMLAEGYGARSWTTEHKALVLKIKTDHGNLILAKPQTFMNKSGESVQAITHFYKIPLENILVAQDDIDQEFGKIRFHKNRGHGGHNGIRNISELLGTPDYARLKLGVSRPPVPGPEVVDWVLSKFSSDEETNLPAFLNRAGDATESWMQNGLQIASTQFNG